MAMRMRMRMGGNRKILLMILLTYRWFVVGKCEGAVALECLQKLLVCQPLLKDAAEGNQAPPPNACCNPLNEMLEQDPKCMCLVFGNGKLLQSFNATQEDALKLAKACGSTPDLTPCEEEAAKEKSSTTTPSYLYIGGCISVTMAATAIATALLILPPFYF